MDIEEAIKYIIDGEGVLFLGAGFSTKATNILGNKLQTASVLSESLCKELKVPPKENLSDVADYYLSNEMIKDGDKKLVNKLIDYYRCKRVEEEHKQIADLDWIRVYTTNYDNVFELASNAVGRRRTGYIISDDMKYIEKKESILHINGYINKLTIDQLNDQFKLTTTSYMRDDFSETPWYGLLRNDLARARVIVLIGVSMDYDNELQKMLSENTTYKDKIIFIDKKENIDIVQAVEKDPLYKFKKRKYGKIYEIDTEGFSKKIYEVKNKYIPKSKKIEYNSFTHINEKNYNVQKLNGNDYWNLLIYGDVEEKLIFNNVMDNKYIIDRKQFDNFQNEIKSNNLKVAIIHSDLGNGKTCSAMKLSYKLKEVGEVFWLNDDNESTLREVEEICGLPGMKFIFIENYGNYFNLLSKLKIYIDDSVKLILTERTSIHKSIYYTMKDKIGIGDEYIREYNLNEVLYEDLDNLIYIIDKIDKWEDRELDHELKRKKLSEDYRKTFREILIKLVKSKNISEKIDDVYNKIKDNRIKKKILIAVCINSIIRTELELNDIIALLEIKISNNIIKDSSLNELINFDLNTIKAKSSILAEYILSRNNLKNEILEIMKKMAIRANKIKYGNKIQNVIKDFVSTSNLLLVLGKKDEKISKEILEYYEELKDSYKRNPFFYLQYAMACLDMKYYDRAGEYLDIAYKEAELINISYSSRNKENRFDTYQIDTQNGRYILEKAINDKNERKPYSTFSRVHDLFIITLNNEKTQEQLVYRQVINYKYYFETYKNLLSYDERHSYMDAVNEMLDKMETYNIIKKDSEIKYIISQLKSLVGDIIKSMYC